MTISDVTPHTATRIRTSPTPTPDTDGAGVPMLRLVRVELRKLVDTRSGLWLGVAIVGIAVLIDGLLLVFGTAEDLGLRTFLGATSTGLNLLLPILGILTATTEFTQRTGLVTFALEPRRGRMYAAKSLAAVLLGTAASVLVAVVAAGLTAVVAARQPQVDHWDLPAVKVLAFLGVNALLVLIGVGFGMLIGNTAAAVVAIVALPMLYTMLGAAWSAFEPIARWTDINRATTRIMSDTALTGQHWAQLLVSILVWVALPVVAGMFRIQRAEVR